MQSSNTPTGTKSPQESCQGIDEIIATKNVRDLAANTEKKSSQFYQETSEIIALAKTAFEYFQKIIMLKSTCKHSEIKQMLQDADECFTPHLNHLNQIILEFDKNKMDFIYDEENALLEDINLKCRILREKSHCLIMELMIGIDKYNPSTEGHEEDIAYANAVAEEILSNHKIPISIREKIASRYHCLHLIEKSLSTAFSEMLQSVYATKESTAYTVMDNPEEREKYLIIRYVFNLLPLYVYINSKLHFVIGKENYIQSECQSILNTASEISLKNAGLYGTWHDAQNTKTTDLQKVIEFISHRLDFFAAPFEDDDFQSFAQDNHEAMQTLSDELRQYLKTYEEIATFKMALIGISSNTSAIENPCLRNKDDKPLRAFLMNYNNQAGKTGAGLIAIFKSHINNPIIQKWYENKYQNNVSQRKTGLV